MENLEPRLGRHASLALTHSFMLPNAQLFILQELRLFASVQHRLRYLSAFPLAFCSCLRKRGATPQWPMLFDPRWTPILHCHLNLSQVTILYLANTVKPSLPLLACFSYTILHQFGCNTCSPTSGATPDQPSLPNPLFPSSTIDDSSHHVRAFFPILHVSRSARS